MSAARSSHPPIFSQREFSFYEIPLMHIQITPIRRSPDRRPSNCDLRASEFADRPHTGKPSNWHLVSISRGVITTPADANLLIDQLKLKDRRTPNTGASGVSIIRNSAKILWPMIQKLAERELYISDAAAVRAGPAESARLSRAATAD